MTIKRRTLALQGVASMAVVFAAASARADLSAEELAKIAQNPVANLISVPFQYNANLNYGPEKATQSILNIQPVVPFELNKDWNLITRTIVPVIWQPALAPGDSSTTGIGATQVSAFFSPSNAQGTIWGVGPITQFPTTSSSKLGSYRWGLGPTFVALKLKKGNPWVYGFLVNNIWSVGNGAGGSYNNFLLQPFVNYNFAGGTYLSSAPIITANWKANSTNRWTVPLGIALGHIFHLGKLPVNTQIGGYYNVVKPDFGSNWLVRAQVQLMFPK
jgi:hypothetical protein